jgi:hypothetical protein
MKSEERHQLLTNDLGVATKKVANYLEGHVGTIIGSVVGVIVVAIIALWWSSVSENANTGGWTLLYSAMNSPSQRRGFENVFPAEEYGNVVDKFKGKPPAHWAQLQIAENNLRTALPLMFKDREIATTDLRKAREAFDELLGDSSVSGDVRERARWGLGQCLEAMCDGDTSKPIDAYNQLLKQFPSSIFKQVAEDRITALKKPGAKEFYSWFSKERPMRAELNPDFGRMKFDKDKDDPFPPGLFDVPKGLETPPTKGEAADQKPE